MKTYVLFVFFLINGAELIAQNSPELEYLLNGSVEVSAFGGPLVEFSSLKGELAVSNGGGGAILLNKKFFIGGYGFRLSNDVNITVTDTDQSILNFNHGGLWLGYIHQPTSLIHFGGSLKIGRGTVSLHELPTTIPPVNFPNFDFNSDNVLVFSPQGEIEMNVTKWFKLNAGIGYRMVTGVNNDYLNKNDLNGINFSLGFLFGWYGRGL